MSIDVASLVKEAIITKVDTPNASGAEPSAKQARQSGQTDGRRTRKSRQTTERRRKKPATEAAAGADGADGDVSFEENSAAGSVASAPAARGTQAKSRARPDNGAKPYTAEPSSLGPLRRKDLVSTVTHLRSEVMRLSADHRLNSREQNLILQFKPECVLKRVMCSVRDKWQETLPENTRFNDHPEGPLHIKYFEVVLAALRTLENLEIMENDWLDTVAQNQPALARFFPLSKGKHGQPPDGNWLWQLRFSAKDNAGIELHQGVLRNVHLFDRIDIVARADDAPRSRAIKALSGIVFE